MASSWMENPSYKDGLPLNNQMDHPFPVWGLQRQSYAHVTSLLSRVAGLRALPLYYTTKQCSRVSWLAQTGFAAFGKGV